MLPTSYETALAGVDSYPTFWNLPAVDHPSSPVEAAEAYSTFVNLTEQDLPDQSEVNNGQSKTNQTATDA